MALRLALEDILLNKIFVLFRVYFCLPDYPQMFPWKKPSFFLPCAFLGLSVS